MKSVPMTSTIGINMDLDRWNLIVPSTATRRLQLAGGQPMEQAVPEDYVIAGMVLRAIEQRNGRELEFILKCYLPIAIVESPFSNRSYLVELLGLTSESMICHKGFNTTSIIKELETSGDPKTLLKCVKATRELVASLRTTNRSTLLGLMSGLMARGIGHVLERPLRNQIENYEVILSGIIKQKEFETSIDTLLETAGILSGVEETVTQLIELTTTKVESTMEKTEIESAPILSRLELRIESLHEQIETLESDLAKVKASSVSNKKARLAEIKKTLDARRSALERDIARRDGIQSKIHGASRDLLVERDNLNAEFQAATKTILDQLSSIIDMSVPISTESVGDKRALVLLPFFITGFSKKGQLRIEIYPISQLTTNGEKVSRRRDFVDGFTSPSRTIDAITSLLLERANNDVAFRKFIRESSQDFNLLAVKESRELILEGAESLMGDGLVKQPLVKELQSIISGIPETKIKKRMKRRVTPLVSDGSLSRVRFHIQDEAGRPVEGAELELGAITARSDSKGTIVVSIPMSRYEGVVQASGYLDKPVEFTLNSTSDVAIPIMLNSLSHEERIAARLDELVDRSRRLDMIRERLWEAFETQGSTLLSIPAYRNALVELLLELGYEPESWIAKAKKKSGMVKRLLKRDDRTDGLRRDILRMAEESKLFGGIMLFAELLVRLDDAGWGTHADEIEDIIEGMTKEGLIQGLSTIEGGALLVEFVPVALTNDPQEILSLAATKDGQLSIEDAVVGLGWTEERVKNALELLVKNGVAKEQRSYSKSTQYWFPGLRGGKK
ncbi:MAG: hypothetical protein PVJ05_08925 [Candidatus Thorarchaeota archaeon]|jgi:hypothetical protein